ncbi:MAG: hypothetical protein Q4C56_08430 [Peptococcaceae bacterium]|nr:hypothetical protein [Peptococcaceae bacterium]
MGKNLYETPRNKSKWHTQNEGKEKSFGGGAQNKKSHLEDLKKRYQEKKK